MSTAVTEGPYIYEAREYCRCKRLKQAHQLFPGLGDAAALQQLKNYKATHILIPLPHNQSSSTEKKTNYASIIKLLVAIAFVVAIALACVAVTLGVLI